MKKRSVLIKKWIPAEYIYHDGFQSDELVKGTHCFEEDFSTPGVFHEWGVGHMFIGTKLTTVALVEIEDGTVECVLPQNIKFLKY